MCGGRGGGGGGGTCFMLLAGNTKTHLGYIRDLDGMASQICVFVLKTE